MEIFNEIEQLKKEQVEPRKIKCYRCRQMYGDVVKYGNTKLCQNCYTRIVEEKQEQDRLYPIRRSRDLIKKIRGELKEVNDLLGMYEKRQR